MLDGDCFHFAADLLDIITDAYAALVAADHVDETFHAGRAFGVHLVFSEEGNDEVHDDLGLRAGGG